MLHILLVILKITGILLAALLGIIVVVLVCALFVPVRYRIEAEGKLGSECPVRVGVKVSWLLHIVRVAFTYPEAAYVRVKVLCFTVFDSSKLKKSAGDKKEGKKKAKKRNAAEKGGGEPLPPELENGDGGSPEGTGPPGVEKSEKKETKAEQISVMEQAGDGLPETGEGPGAAEETEAGALAEEAGEESDPEADGREDAETGFWVKIKAFYQAFRHFLRQFAMALENIEYTIKEMCDKIKGIVENIQYYAGILKSRTFRRAWAVSKGQLVRIFRMLRPQSCQAYLLIGTGDPAGTGQAMAIYGILYPWIGNHVRMDADFERKAAEGSLFVKGRVQAFVFVLAAFRLFISRDIRRLLKMFKKEDMVNGRK